MHGPYDFSTGAIYLPCTVVPTGLRCTYLQLGQVPANEQVTESRLPTVSQADADGDPGGGPAPVSTYRKTPSCWQPGICTFCRHAGSEPDLTSDSVFVCATCWQCIAIGQLELYIAQDLQACRFHESGIRQPEGRPRSAGTVLQTEGLWPAG
jgi:hypothetical protein